MKNLKKFAKAFQFAIHFHPSHPQPKIVSSSICLLLGGLLLTEPKHYLNVSMEANLANQVDAENGWHCPFKPNSILLNKRLCEFHRTHTTVRLRTRLNLTFVSKATFTRDWFKKSKLMGIFIMYGTHCMYPLTVYIQAPFLLICKK